MKKVFRSSRRRSAQAKKTHKARLAKARIEANQRWMAWRQEVSQSGFGLPPRTGFRTRSRQSVAEGALLERLVARL